LILLEFSGIDIPIGIGDFPITIFLRVHPIALIGSAALKMHRPLPRPVALGPISLIHVSIGKCVQAMTVPIALLDIPRIGLSVFIKNHAVASEFSIGPVTVASDFLSLDQTL
jgi:hypothetical protein